MPKCKCGTEVDDWRGARGHVQFTDEDGHGPKGEVPGDWKETLFGGESSEADEDDEQDADQSPTPTEESDSNQSHGSMDRLIHYLTTPVDELLLNRGGDE